MVDEALTTHSYILFDIPNNYLVDILSAAIESMHENIPLAGKKPPNKPNDKASSNVDLPAPFCPTINVVGDLVRSIVIGSFPVDKKFFHETDLKCIILYYTTSRFCASV